MRRLQENAKYRNPLKFIHKINTQACYNTVLNLFLQQYVHNKYTYFNTIHNNLHLWFSSNYNKLTGCTNLNMSEHF